MIRTFAAFTLALVLAASAQAAGKYNKILSIGDAAPKFADLPGTDDKMHSLADMKDKDVVVVVVTCNHCPVAVAYEDRIIAFTKKYSGSADSKVGVIALCVNDLESDKLEPMKERAKKKGFNFTYVYDESQKSGLAFGATKTPEFFVLNKERKIVYMGALDDSQSNPKKSYLSDAVDAVLKGETPAVAETQPVGCGVKYSKKK